MLESSYSSVHNIFSVFFPPELTATVTELASSTSMAAHCLIGAQPPTGQITVSHLCRCTRRERHHTWVCFWQRPSSAGQRESSFCKECIARSANCSRYCAVSGFSPVIAALRATALRRQKNIVLKGALPSQALFFNAEPGLNWEGSQSL